VTPNVRAHQRARIEMPDIEVMGQTRSAEPALPMADIRSIVPSSRAFHRPLAGGEGGVVRERHGLAAVHPRAVDGVEAWWRHAHGQSAQERARSLASGHKAVGALFHPLLSDRRAQHVAQQSLATLGINPACAGGLVQGEPIERCTERPIVGECA